MKEREAWYPPKNNPRGWGTDKNSKKVLPFHATEENHPGNCQRGPKCNRKISKGGVENSVHDRKNIRHHIIR